MSHKFRAYCDICNVGGPWFPDDELTKSWRSIHFSHKHPDNPMEKQNCRIQREDE